MLYIAYAAYISLGCPKNTVDTELMLNQLEKEYEITDDFDKADVLIVNTCGFIRDAKEESLNAIYTLANIKAGTNKLLIVTGCLSQRYSDELLKEIPEINVCMGVEQYMNILHAIHRAKGGERFAMCGRINFAITGKRKLITPKSVAYVKIAEGCNNRCSFCAIPMIRGSYRSVPMNIIEDEVKQLVSEGIKEIIFIAEDTTRYGIDIYGKPVLDELVDKIAQIDGLLRLRLLYCYPDSLTKELIDTMSKHENVCNYLDIPLQHGDAELLKSMNRKGNPLEYSDIISYAKSKGFIIRTTFIVGFPGETREQFIHLVEYVKRMKFDRLGVFTYSPEEGTKGAQMPNQISESLKQKRKDELLQVQADISYNNNQDRIGEIVEVLVERKENGNVEARSYGEAPDIDGLVILKDNENIKIGEIYKAKIVSADTYDLYAEWM